MIRYTLTCASDHSFEGWFQSADAFDRLRLGGHVACTLCGSTEVAKSLMAPTVQPARRAGAEPALAPPQTPVEKALRALRRRIEETSDYVGPDFAAEARAIHEGAAPERSIYGEARPEEARRLIEDGIPVAPLPFVPARKTN